MATSQTGQVIRHLREAALLRDAAGLTDRQLLEGFIGRRDEAAFGALVRRHGPMVLGVCLRVLGHRQDAEDAFQATFLVLARKAASLASPESLANWLHGVACNTARKARAAINRRRAREKQVAALPEPQTVPQEPWDDLRPLLDRELSRLPLKYRAPLVLCDLEGKTRQDAARQLGWPEGTLSGRLSRARAILAKRLASRGLPLSGVVVAAVLSRDGASACVPPALAVPTAKAASLAAAGQAAPGLVSARVAVLAEGVVKAMLLSRLKTVVALGLVVAVLGLGGGAVAWQTRAAGDGPPGRRPRGEQPAKDKDDDNLRNTIWALEERREEAAAKGDVDTQQKFLADDHLSVSRDGRNDKAALAEGARRHRIADLKARDVEVRRVSEDVAVLTYVYSCKVLSNDGELLATRRDRRYSCVWALRKGGWVVVFTQDTVLPGGE